MTKLTKWITNRFKRFGRKEHLNFSQQILYNLILEQVLGACDKLKGVFKKIIF